MKTSDPSPKPGRASERRILSWIVAGAIVLGLLAMMPGVWALPEQAPDFQTLPTLTPTPTPRGATATPTRPAPNPTDTPAPSATPADTPGPGTPTATPTASVVNTPSPTPTRAATVVLSAGPSVCWTSPTPGFEPVSLDDLEFEATSDQGLVVPGQTITLRLDVTNLGTTSAEDLIICNPLDPALLRGKAMASQGKATLVPEGLIVELGDLPAGQSATAELTVTIPVNFPLGGVIEDQAWLYATGQQASTSLLTWALPPAYLPPTGK